MRSPLNEALDRNWIKASAETERLERELAAANARVEALKADRDKLLVMASRMADCINRCQDEDDCSDLSAAYDFRQEYPR